MSLLLLTGFGDDLPRRVAEDLLERVEQEGQEPDLPKPLTLEAPELPFKPRYEAGSALRLSVLWLQPRVSYDTREYNPGVFSGDVDLSRRGGLPRYAPGLSFSLDLGPMRADGGFVHMAVRQRLERSLSYEEETFEPGEAVSVLAQAGWLDVAYRLRLLGDARSRSSVSALVGVNAPRVKITVENDRASAREGFDALWPVPAVGVEAHYWLTDRIKLHGSLMGTRLKFTNPFHEDAGEPQHVAFAYLRMDAGVTVDLDARWSLTLGYTRFAMDVTASSKLDDKDRAIFEAGGLFLALDYRF